MWTLVAAKFGSVCRPSILGVVTLNGEPRREQREGAQQGEGKTPEGLHLGGGEQEKGGKRLIVSDETS